MVSKGRSDEIMITLKDVAREAGVAVSTVSNVLNGLNIVAPDTQNRVLEAVGKLGYVPNINGRNLKAKATKKIGLFVSSMRGDFYGILADSIYHACQHGGYEFHIVLTLPNNAGSIDRSIFGKQFDGALVLNNELPESIVDLFDKTRLPVVFLDRRIKSGRISSVVFDSYNGGEMATRYLVGLGAKKIGYIHGYNAAFDDIERFRAYCHVLEEFSLTRCLEYELDGYFEEDAAYMAVKNFLRKGFPLPDAFFAANDYMAIGCIRSLTDNNIRVPEDISVIGYDNIELSKYFTPSISTINSPAHDLGKKAAEVLINMITNEADGDIYTIRNSLIVRSSCMSMSK